MSKKQKEQWTLEIQPGDEWWFGGHGFKDECSTQAVISDNEDSFAVGSATDIKKLYLASKAPELLTALKTAWKLIEDLLNEQTGQIQDMGQEVLLIKETIKDATHLPKEFKQ